MSAAEISYLMELNKRKSELEFKKGYLLRKGAAHRDPRMISMDAELAEVAKQAAVLESKIMARIDSLFYPNENQLAEFGKKLAALAPAEIDRAMETRGGDAYAILEKRGAFLKSNFERRDEIAALIEFASSLPSKVRDEIVERVRAGKVGSLDASTLDEKTRTKLFTLLNRVGIPCALDGYKLMTESAKGRKWGEVRVELNGNRVWVDEKREEEVRSFGKELVETGNAIQLMNAERQVTKFGPEDEKKFTDLQKKYLGLVRKRDELMSA
ncbi:Uncharacterised protein [uncultured archaeon]|nr:Uncharacterised protein [uncultured archaeon]